MVKNAEQNPQMYGNSVKQQLRNNFDEVELHAMMIYIAAYYSKYVCDVKQMYQL